MASSTGSSTLNGDVVVGFFRSLINCDAEIDAAYSEEVLCMSKWLAKKSTLSGVLSALVLGM